MKTQNQFLYWRMANGHEHSYLHFDTENVLKEFATDNEKGELTQEQYITYIEKNEFTQLEDIKIIDFTELTVEFAQELLNNDYIADFEVQENGEPFIEFY